MQAEIPVHNTEENSVTTKQRNVFNTEPWQKQEKKSKNKQICSSSLPGNIPQSQLPEFRQTFIKQYMTNIVREETI